MPQPISMKQAELKVFRTASNDGLLDVMIGSFVLIFAVAPLLSGRLGDFWSSVIFLPFWVLVFAGVRLVRKRVVVPRIGLVRFGQSTKNRMSRFGLLMVAVNVIALFLGLYVSMHFRPGSGFLYAIALGSIVFVMASLAAYFFHCVRFFIYGLLFFFSFPVGEWLFVHRYASHHGFPVMFGATAGIVILTGLVIFLRIWIAYPVPSEPSVMEEKEG